MENFKIPDYIEEYHIEEKIGEGGNSYVYKASKDGSHYAIKILKYNLTGINKKRYENEVDFQMNTKNKNIVNIISRGKYQDREYYIMPLYTCSFRKIIDGDDYEHLIKLYLDICNALSYIHNNSKETIIHRDIKPENFLYDEKNDKLLLSDFGIACFNKPNQTKTGDAKVGNFSYSAPEQRKLKNKKYGTYTDIFSMGLILNEIFTKQIPNGNDYQKISSLNPLFYELDKIVDSMLKFSSEDRENDINDIINKIQCSFAKIKENYEEIDVEYHKELKQIDNDDLRAIIRNDLCLIYTYLPIIIKYQKTVYHRYHTNIVHKYTKNFKESLRLIKIYESVKDKFDYESNSNYLDTRDMIVANCNEPFIKLRKILFCVESFRDLDSLKRQIIKLFVTLEEYHQIEVIRDIANINVEENHTLYDVFQDLCILDQYLSIYDGIALCSFIDISDQSYIDENMINEFIEIIDETKIRKLKDFYRDYNITIDNDGKSILMICYDKSKLPIILQAIENELDSNPSYIEEGDLIDAKNKIEDLEKNSKAQCGYFLLENIIFSKVMKQKF